MKGLVLSEGSAAGMDGLVEPFRRQRFSSALSTRTFSKCCTPVKQAYRHLDRLQARSSQVSGSMPVDSMLALKLSLKLLLTVTNILTDEVIAKSTTPRFFETQSRPKLCTPV